MEALDSPFGLAYSRITFHKDYFEDWTPNGQIDVKFRSKVQLAYRVLLR